MLHANISVDAQHGAQHGAFTTHRCTAADAQGTAAWLRNHEIPNQDDDGAFRDTVSDNQPVGFLKGHVCGIFCKWIVMTALSFFFNIGVRKSSCFSFH